MKPQRPFANFSKQDREVLYHMQAEMCRVLGHAKRLQILDLLAEGEKSSAELIHALGISKVNLSQHLAVMRYVGLIESRQQGREAFHRLAFAEIKDACRMTREVLAGRLNQNRRMAQKLSASESATRDESPERGE